MSDQRPIVPRGRSGGALWLLALVGAMLASVGAVAALGYRVVRTALGERRERSVTAPSPPPNPGAPRRPAAAPAPSPPRGMRPRYGPDDARATPQDAYRALLEALRREDAATAAKYELKAKLARQTSPDELLREMSGSVPYDEARIARAKTRGDRAVLIVDVMSKAVTDERGRPARVQVVVRMVKEDGYWKLFRQTWLIATPLGPHEREATAWLAEPAPGTGGEARRRLAAMGVSYDATNFQFAVAKGDLEQVELFLDAGMSPATRMENGTESLFSLALLGLQGSSTSDELVIAMIRSGSAPLEERTPTGLTPIARAALSCRPKVVEALLRAGANPGSKDNDGRTPLDWARQMCPAAVQALRGAGAR